MNTSRSFIVFFLSTIAHKSRRKIAFHCLNKTKSDFALKVRENEIFTLIGKSIMISHLFSVDWVCHSWDNHDGHKHLFWLCKVQSQLQATNQSTCVQVIKLQRFWCQLKQFSAFMTQPNTIHHLSMAIDLIWPRLELYQFCYSLQAACKTWLILSSNSVQLVLLHRLLIFKLTYTTL